MVGGAGGAAGAGARSGISCRACDRASRFDERALRACARGVAFVPRGEAAAGGGAGAGTIESGEAAVRAVLRRKRRDVASRGVLGATQSGRIATRGVLSAGSASSTSRLSRRGDGKGWHADERGVKGGIVASVVSKPTPSRAAASADDRLPPYADGASANSMETRRSPSRRFSRVGEEVWCEPPRLRMPCETSTGTAPPGAAGAGAASARASWRAVPLQLATRECRARASRTRSCETARTAH